MGEYYNWTNIDCKEYIDSVAFDFGQNFINQCRPKEN